MICTALFAGGSILGTVLLLAFPYEYYGFGFLIASMAFVLACTVRLNHFTKRLPYYILASQPLVSEDRSGRFTKLGIFLEEKLERELR